MVLDDPTGYGQPEPGSSGIATAGCIEPGKSLKDAISRFGWNTRSVIRDGQGGEG